MFSAIIKTRQRCFLNNNYVSTRNAPKFNSFGHMNSFGARMFIFIIDIYLINGYGVGDFAYTLSIRD